MKFKVDECIVTSEGTFNCDTIYDSTHYSPGLISSMQAAGVIYDTSYVNGTGGTGGGDPTEIASIKSQIDDIFSMIYAPPTVSLTLNPSTAVREIGESIASTVLTAVVGKKTQNITKVEFFNGSSVINTVASPNANGGTFNYTFATPITATTTFKAKATDTKGSAESSKTITFVYPMYAGVVANATPTATEIKAMKKIVTAKGNTPNSFTANGQRFVFAYPASYGNLTSIVDQNGFETIGSYTVSTVNITGLDGTAVSYRVYTLSTTTTQTNFTNTFKF